MALGEPLLSIIRNAAEWLADSKDNVTLLLSPTKNVFNGDTEGYSLIHEPSNSFHDANPREYPNSMKAPYLSECLYAIPHIAWPFESATVHRMVGVTVLMEVHVLLSIRSVVSDWDCQSTCLDSMFPIWDTECYLVQSVLIFPVDPYCNSMPSAFEMVT